KVPQRGARVVQVSDLAIDHGEDHLCDPESGHVHAQYEFQGTLGIALTIRVNDHCKPIPTGMVGVELCRAFGESAAAFPITGEGKCHAEKSSDVALHAMESQGA